MQGTQSALIALLGLAGALALADVGTTARALARGGRESNPVVRAMMARLGRLWWVPRLLGAGAGIALIWAGRDGALALPAAVALVVLTAAAVGLNLARTRRRR